MAGSCHQQSPAEPENKARNIRPSTGGDDTEETELEEDRQTAGGEGDATKGGAETEGAREGWPSSDNQPYGDHLQQTPGEPKDLAGKMQEKLILKEQSRAIKQLEEEDKEQMEEEKRVKPSVIHNKSKGGEEDGIRERKTKISI